MFDFRTFIENVEDSDDRANAIRSFLKSPLKENQKIVVSRYKKSPIIPPTKLVLGDKPIGGLWYGCGSSWFHFLYTDARQWIHSYIHEVIIDSSKMAVIKNEIDFLQFTKNHGIKYRGTHEIDWKHVARKYSGIDCCQWYTRSDWLYGWDVSSGVIWDKAALIDSRLLFEYNSITKQYEPV